MRFFLTGFMGCGKSFWGRRLAPIYNLPFFDLDEVIETSEGKSISTIFEEIGEEAFRELEKFHLHNIIQHHSKFIMSTGGGTPCYSDNLQLMNAKGISIYVKASPEFLANNLRNEIHQRPLLANISEMELENFIERKLLERKSLYEMSTYIVEANSVNEIIFGDIILQYV
ncbi:MAG: shikimate kinase [Bacteroidetes bacterium]|nr:shikimate kinase [Bacteroidota bacterium]